MEFVSQLERWNPCLRETVYDLLDLNGCEAGFASKHLFLTHGFFRAFSFIIITSFIQIKLEGFMNMSKLVLDFILTCSYQISNSVGNQYLCKYGLILLLLNQMW